MTSLWCTSAVLVYGVVAVVLPILALAYVALTPFWSGKIGHQSLTLANLRTVLLTNIDSQEAVKTSIITAAITIVIVLPIGFACALAISERVRAPIALRRALDYLVSVPLGMPVAVIGFAILFAYTGPPIDLYGSRAILVVSYVTLMLPYATRSQLGTLLALSPDFWDAARVHGGRPARVMLRVTLPLCRTSLASGAVVVLILVLHEFTVSILVQSPGVQVMGTALYNFWSGGSYSDVAAMALVMVVVTTVGVCAALLVAGRRALESL